MTASEIKKNRTQAALQKMKEAGYDPMAALIALAKDDRVDIDTRIDCHKTLIKYIYPTLKHVEVDAQIKQDLIVHVKQFIKPNNVISIEEGKHDKSEPIPIEGDSIDIKAIAGAGGHHHILPD